MSETKMSPSGEEALQEFKDAWLNKEVKIVGLSHPHFGKAGIASSIDYTKVGWGMKVEFEDGNSCYVFIGTEIRLLN